MIAVGAFNELDELNGLIYLIYIHRVYILFRIFVYKVRIDRSQRDRLEPSFGATLEEAPRWPQTPGETPRGMAGEGGGDAGASKKKGRKDNRNSGKNETLVK